MKKIVTIRSNDVVTPETIITITGEVLEDPSQARQEKDP